METFTYHRAADRAAAVTLGRQPDAKYLGGGTNLVDLMREGIETPAALVDVTGLSRTIEDTAGGGLLIGAAASNAALAEHLSVRRRYPALARAVLAGASVQIRNMATIGGNLLQRTRCSYFYDVEGSRCNKRTPGQGCDALDGFNRYHAVLGTSGQCIATHPSDMGVALVAFDAVLHLDGPGGSRRIPLHELHLPPGETPQRETSLAPGELITAVELPPLAVAARSAYRKVRDRSSYAFALVSVAGALQVVDGKIADVRLALGGVGTTPWRARKAEQLLLGASPTGAQFLAAARAEFASAAVRRDNAFKPRLAEQTMAAVLRTLAGEQA